MRQDGGGRRVCRGQKVSEMIADVAGAGCAAVPLSGPAVVCPVFPALETNRDSWWFLETTDASYRWMST